MGLCGVLVVVVQAGCEPLVGEHFALLGCEP
jgi:hypothetical protein